MYRINKNKLITDISVYIAKQYKIIPDDRTYNIILDILNSLTDEYINDNIDLLPMRISEYAMKQTNKSNKQINNKQINIRQSTKQATGQAAKIINDIPNYKQIQISRKIEKSNPELKSMTDDVSIDEWLHKEIGTTSEIPEDNKNIVVKKDINAEKINIESILGITKINEIQRLFNPESTYRKCYVVLDSRNRLYSESSNTSFKWIYSNSLNVEKGTVNSIAMPRDIISIKIYQPVFPRVSGINANTGRISILISEFSTQAFVASESRKYHFLTRIVDSSDVIPARRHIELQTEDYNDGIFNFMKPITVINSFTISFGDPINIISIPNDYPNVTFVSYGFNTTVATVTAHNLSTGSIVYFTDFTTLDPLTDMAVINLINDPYGLSITVTSTTTFRFNIDTSGISGIPNLTIPCYFNQYQFLIPMEITYKTY